MCCGVKKSYRNCEKPNNLAEIATLMLLTALVSVCTPATVAGIFVTLLSLSKQIPE
jgi:hypothetical protein